jgi:hypothetical protein
LFIAKNDAGLLPDISPHRGAPAARPRDDIALGTVRAERKASRGTVRVCTVRAFCARSTVPHFFLEVRECDGSDRKHHALVEAELDALDSSGDNRCQLPPIETAYDTPDAIGFNAQEKPSSEQFRRFPTAAACGFWR